MLKTWYGYQHLVYSYQDVATRSSCCQYESAEACIQVEASDVFQGLCHAGLWRAGMYM